MNKLTYVLVICFLSVLAAVGEGIFLGKKTPESLHWLAERNYLTYAYIFLAGGLFSLLTLVAIKHLGLNINETGPLSSLGVISYLLVRWGVFRLTPEGNGWSWLQAGSFLALSILALFAPGLPNEILGRLKKGLWDQ
ncbi:MAG: hypothetical protein M1150_00255 [Patescibacteria group bacterium]|nr:hypothetical protein [Patescibacteria group bacterium]